MGEEVKIDKQQFHERLNQLVSAWKGDKRSGDSTFGGVGSLLILLGKSDDPGYQKSNALHFWLLGYEFPATLLLFTPESLWVVTTAKKAKHLEPLKNGKIPIEVLLRGKDNEQNAKLWEKVLDVIKSSGVRILLEEFRRFRADCA